MISHSNAYLYSGFPHNNQLCDCPFRILLYLPSKSFLIPKAKTRLSIDNKSAVIIAYSFLSQPCNPGSRFHYTKD